MPASAVPELAWSTYPGLFGDVTVTGRCPSMHQCAERKPSISGGETALTQRQVWLA